MPFKKPQGNIIRPQHKADSTPQPLLERSHLVRSEKMRILYGPDNLLYIIENSVLESATQVLSEFETLLNKPLESAPITLGSWISGDRDGNPL